MAAVISSDRLERSAIDGHTRIEARDERRDLPERGERHDHASRQGIEQIGLDVEGKASVVPDPVNVEAGHRQNIRYLASGRPCLAT